MAFEREGDPGPALLIVGLVAWDSDGDAAEFEPVMRLYLQDRLPGRHLLERRGARVLFAAQVPPDAPPGLVEHAWAVFSPVGG